MIWIFMKIFILNENISDRLILTHFLYKKKFY